MKLSRWDIRNGEGGRVTSRATKHLCVELLKKYAGTKHWDNGPYTVWRVHEERVYTHRSTPTPSKGGE